MGLGLSGENIAALENRTEGWIAGLQMAALSLEGRSDTALFIRAFSGSHRFVLDYLLEGVLHRQSAHVSDFLLQTAILDRLCPSLCDAVTGSKDGTLMLDTLDRVNLFIVPLDDKRQWYRCHHLFSDVLKERLKAVYPDRVSALHRKAGEMKGTRIIYQYTIGELIISLCATKCAMNQVDFHFTDYRSDKAL